MCYLAKSVWIFSIKFEAWCYPGAYSKLRSPICPVSSTGSVTSQGHPLQGPLRWLLAGLLTRPCTSPLHSLCSAPDVNSQHVDQSRFPLRAASLRAFHHTRALAARLFVVASRALWPGCRSLVAPVSFSGTPQSTAVSSIHSPEHNTSFSSSRPPQELFPLSEMLFHSFSRL